jgi:endonuclease/exonuclease/phosphatase family metal-dependent hydrolase
VAALNRTIRVGTWNLHEGVPAEEFGSWGRLSDRPEAQSSENILRKTAHSIVDLVNELELDIVGFQEVRFDGGRSPDMEVVAAETALQNTALFPLSPSSFFQGSRAGVAIASRYPLTEVRTTKLPNPNLEKSASGQQISSHDKGLLSARVEVLGRPVSVASLHMLPFHIFERSADDLAFREIWRQLTTELASLSGRPLVVCGDFNTSKRDLALHNGPVELFSAVGDRSTYNGAAVDDILYSADFSPGAVSTFGNFSDHAFCVGELKLT